MPFTIHEKAFKKQHTVNIMRPQEQVPVDISPEFGGTLSQGLPVMQIPHMEYPRVVYMHPNDPYRTIEHRNEKYEVVGLETVPTEHLTKVVANETELAAAIEEGWVKEPYIPKAAKNPTEHLYGPKGKKKAS